MSLAVRFQSVLGVLILSGFWGVLTGCGGPASTPSFKSESKPAPLSSQGEIKTPAASDIDIKVVKFDQWVEAVKTHRGKVVVVDIWADW